MKLSNLEQYKKNVFICHQKEDVEVVQKIVQRLNENKINAWVDYENLSPGEDWKNRIKEEIKNTDAVIVCISKLASEKEGYFHLEIDFALERIKLLPPKKRVFILPILIDDNDEIYPTLENYHHLKINVHDDGEWFEKILASLGIERQEKMVYSIERQRLVVNLEKLKLELVECWIQRDTFSNNNKKWHELEQRASNYVHHINESCEQIGEIFRPELLYRKVKFSNLINKSSSIPKLNSLKYMTPHAVLVPENYIDSIIFIIEKGQSISSACASKVVVQFEDNHIICGYAMFYSYSTDRGAIQPNKTYQVFDSTNESLAYLIGEFST